MSRNSIINKLSMRQGFTLIELVLSIVIISICLTGAMLVCITVGKSSADPMLQQQAISIGNSYLEEIMAKSFPTSVSCIGAPAGGRTVFTNVCDYQGLNDVGAQDQNGQAVFGLSAYTVQVAIDTTAAVLGTLKPGIDVVRIDVSVTNPNLQTAMVISGYKTRY